ncbi:MAG TPA: hypothetical protein PK156_28675, partial [Polyangium sp.]|nr:hypothetical protein [Polyangium sp.]
NSKETWRMAGVLEDPRWEKLVSGQATPEEVADLRAWARQSRLARKAWDLYRPSTQKEKGALAATILQTIEQQQRDIKKIGRGAKAVATTSVKPIDGRMMSRHRRRVAEDSVKPVSHVRPTIGHQLHQWVGRVIRKPRDSRLFVGTKSAPAMIKIERVGQGLDARRDLSGTTSSRITLTKDAVDVPAARSVAEVSTASELQENMTVLERRLRQTRFGLIAAALICGFLCCFTVSGFDTVLSVSNNVSPVLPGTSVLRTAPLNVLPANSEVMPELTRIEPAYVMQCPAPSTSSSAAVTSVHPPPPRTTTASHGGYYRRD